MTCVFGTKEWAGKNVNCVTGCRHNCRYCYARSMAVYRFKRVAPHHWPRMIVREKEVRKRRRNYGTQIMFPTAHDITPEVLDPCLEVLDKLLEVGNRVLIVSKPHMECIRAICERFTQYKDKILFRFTITSFNDSLLSYWEPGAPGHIERLACLRHAHRNDFQTSVAIEPMLDSFEVPFMVQLMERLVTNAIWIGKMNQVRSRVRIETPIDECAVKLIERNQSDWMIHFLYEQLRQHPMVKWKESIKKVVGLELPSEAGLDE